MLRNTLIIALTAFLLIACSSTKTLYYQLPDSALMLPEKTHTIKGVQLILSEHLRGKHLLYQTDEHTLHFAQQNLWASPLENSLNSALCNKLNRISHIAYAPKEHAQHTELTLYIDRFQGNYRGETEISGYAKWSNGKTQPFHIITTQKGDGYGAMLDSLNQGLDTLAKTLTAYP